MLYNFSVVFFDVLAWIGIGVGVLAGILAGLAGILYSVGIIGAKRVPLKKLLLLTYGDDLVYGVMNFPGRHFDQNNGKVVNGPGPNEYWYGECPWIVSWRRWVFYFGWLVKPVSYDENNNPDGFGSGIYVDLSDHFVTVHVEDAETVDIQDPAHPNDPTKKIAGPAASFDAQCPGLVIDPRLFVIGSPPDVFQKGIVDEFKAAMRRWTRRKTEAELLDASVSGGIGNELLDPVGVNAQAVFNIMLNRWGFDLPPESITIKDVSFSKAYQEARQSARQEAMKAQATTARVYNPVKDAIAAGIDPKDAVRLQALDMGAQVVDMNVHSNNQSINPDALVIGGGGGAGIMIGTGGKSNPGKNPGGGKGNPGGGISSGKAGGPNPEEKRAEQFFDRYGVYPKWDPLKREPVEP